MDEKQENITNIYYIISEYKTKIKNTIKLTNSFLGDIKKILRFYINLDKIKNKALSIAKNQIVREKSRFLTGITGNGIITYESSVSKLCYKIYLFVDEYDSCSHFFMEEFRRYALAQGYNFYCFYSRTGKHNRLKHIIISSIVVGFVCKNQTSQFETITPYKIINSNNFIEK